MTSASAGWGARRPDRLESPLRERSIWVEATAATPPWSPETPTPLGGIWRPSPLIVLLMLVGVVFLLRWRRRGLRALVDPDLAVPAAAWTRRLSESR